MMADWQARALCRNVDTDVFFPDRPGPLSKRAWSIARSVCGCCPVAKQCLDDAMEIEQASRGERYGMFGGLTPAERQTLSARTGVHATPMAV